MNFAISIEKACMTLTLLGPLDGAAAAALRPTVEALATDWPSGLTVDLRQVRFLDGAGLGVLAYLAKRLGPALRVVGASGQPLDLLRHLGLDKVFALPPAPRPARARGEAGSLVWGARAA
jgi:anti-sigma B factor antagonist